MVERRPRELTIGRLDARPLDAESKRVQTDARKHLDLKPMQIEQIVKALEALGGSLRSQATS